MQKKQLIPLLATTLYAPFALGLGLGEITIHSNLNQPLDAEIQITSATQEELKNLVLDVPGNDVFARYDLERIGVLSDFNFQIADKADGTRVIRVTTNSVIKDPFLTFLVEANWEQGRLLREYTVLVDPPLYVPAQTAQTQTTPYVAPAVSGSTQESIARSDLPPQTYPGDSYRQREQGFAGEGYRVKRGDTLWEIANELKPDSSFSVNQTMVAIYRTNQDAFDGNINRLKADRVLRVPDRATVNRISRDIANEEVRAQTSSWRNAVDRTRSADSGTRQSSTAGQTDSGSGTLVLKVPDLSEDAGSGEAGGDSSGSLDATSLATIQELQEKVEEFERLLALRDSELASIKEQLDKQYKVGTTDTTLGSLDPETQDAETADVTTPTDSTDPLDAAIMTPEESDSLDTSTTDVDLTIDTGLGTDESTDISIPTTDATTPDTSAGTSDTSQAAVVDTKPTISTTEPESGFDLAGLLKKLGIGLGGLGLFGLLGFFGYRKFKKGPSRDTLFVDDDLDLTAESIAEKVKSKINKKYEDSGATSEVEVGETTFEEAGIEMPGIEVSGEAEVESLDLDLTGELPVVADSGTGTAEVEALDVDTSVDTSIDSDQALPFDDTTLADATTGSIELDQNDPMAETDFHMAYGLYDQAAELMQTAIKDNNNFEFKEKLLEVFFVSGNKEEFIRYASEIKDEAEASHPGSWDNIVIMGKQLAPGEAMFSGDVGAAGIDEGLDFSLDATGSIQVSQLDVDQSLFGDAGTGHDASAADLSDEAGDFALDLDAADTSGGDMDFALDLDDSIDLPDFTPETDASESAATALAGEADDVLDLDLDMNLDLPEAPVDLEEAIEDFSLDLDASLNEKVDIEAPETGNDEKSASPLDSWESEEDKLEITSFDQTVLQKLDSNDGVELTEEVKVSDILDLDIGSATGITDAPGESNFVADSVSDDMDLDLSDLGLESPAKSDLDADDISEETLDFAFDLDKSDDINIEADTETLTTSDSDTETQSMDDMLQDVFADAGSERTTEINLDDKFDLLLDEGKSDAKNSTLDIELENIFADAGTDEEFADDTLQSMLPEGVTESDSGTMSLESVLDPGDNDGFDEVFGDSEGVINPDDDMASTARITDDQLAAMGLSDEGPDLLGTSGMGFGDDSGVDEVATKLDLARAYIEMDDPENAKSILNEVVDEGSDAQRSEAKDLLISID